MHQTWRYSTINISGIISKTYSFKRVTDPMMKWHLFRVDFASATPSGVAVLDTASCPNSYIVDMFIKLERKYGSATSSVLTLLSRIVLEHFVLWLAYLQHNLSWPAMLPMENMRGINIWTMVSPNFHLIGPRDWAFFKLCIIWPRKLWWSTSLRRRTSASMLAPGGHLAKSFGKNPRCLQD